MTALHAGILFTFTALASGTAGATLGYWARGRGDKAEAEAMAAQLDDKREAAIAIERPAALDPERHTPPEGSRIASDDEWAAVGACFAATVQPARGPVDEPMELEPWVADPPYLRPPPEREVGT